MQDSDASQNIRRRKPSWVRLSAAVFVLAAASASSASETYEYDALGRLIKVTQDDGSEIDFDYDPAGNREDVDVTGSGVLDKNPNGPSAIVVVPLNGFTVIVVD